MKAETPFSTGLLGLAVAATVVTGCSSYKARQEMDKGKQEYRAANFQASAEHFKAASALDDNLVAAKLNLAAAYRAIPPDPGVSTPQGAWFGQQAIDTYQKVLAKDPRNMDALQGISCVAMDLKRFEQAGDFRKRILTLNASDPESYLWVGVVDWSAVNEDMRAQKTKLGLGADEPFRGDQNDKQACEQARSADGARVAEGITMLQKAIEKRPGYDDAMFFLVLLLRQRTDMQCGDFQAWSDYRRLADNLIDQGFAARKRKIENAYKPPEKGNSEDKSDILPAACVLPNPMPPTQTAQSQSK